MVLFIWDVKNLFEKKLFLIKKKKNKLFEDFPVDKTTGL